MPAHDVVNQNEIWLGDTVFPTRGPVRLANITVTPNPIILGDSSKQTETQVMSQFIQPDAAAGTGVFRGNARVEFDRSWYSEAETRFKRQITLPPLVVDLGRGGTETAAVTVMAQFNNELYVAFGVKMYRLNGAAWVFERTLNATPRDAVVYKGLLLIAEGTGIEYRDGAGTWTLQSGVSGADILAVQGDRVLKFGKVTGETSYTLRASTAGTDADGVNWSNIAQTGIEVNAGKILLLPDLQGNNRIYVVTDTGLYTTSGTQLVPTDVQYQRLVSIPYSACVYGQDIIIPLGGLSLMAVRIPGGTTRYIGLDQEDGVPGDQWGQLVWLAPGPDYLYALVWERGITATAPESASLHAWNGYWHTIASHASGLLPAKNNPAQGDRLHVFTFGGTVGILAGVMHNATTPAVKFIDGTPQAATPKHLGNSSTRRSFAQGPVEHVSPWYDFGSEVQKKLISRVYIQTEGCSSDETVEVFYATDFGTTWTSLGTIISNGFHTLRLNGRKGINCQQFALKYKLKRGAANANKRPLIDYAVIEYMRLLPATYGFSVEIDLTKPYRGMTPAQLEAKLLELADPAQTPEFIEFAYRPDQGTEAQTYYVKISRSTGSTFGGRDLNGQGTWLISLMAPYAEDAV